MIPINSPVTGEDQVTEVEKIETNKIIELYHSSLDLDVRDYFKDLNEISLYRCITSGYRFYYPFNITGDARFYENLQGKYKYFHAWNWQNRTALKFIKKQDKVLEIGCGDGTFLKRIAQKRNAEVTGLEINQSAISLATEKGLTILNETITDHAKDSQGRYDVICCFQVLEHITQVREFILNCRACLKKGGIFICAVPNNNPYLYKYDKFNVLNLPPHHAGLWNKTSLMNLGALFNFEVIDCLIEPNRDLKNQLLWILNNKSNKLGARILKKIPYRLFNFIFTPLIGYFFEGNNVLAIYRKARMD